MSKSNKLRVSKQYNSVIKLCKNQNCKTDGTKTWMSINTVACPTCNEYMGFGVDPCKYKTIRGR